MSRQLRSPPDWSVLELSVVNMLPHVAHVTVRRIFSRHQRRRIALQSYTSHPINTRPLASRPQLVISVWFRGAGQPRGPRRVAVLGRVTSRRLGVPPPQQNWVLQGLGTDL